MSTNKVELSELAHFVAKDLELDQELFQDNPTNEEAFRQKLASLISKMLDQDFERFLSLMYRLDISENKLKEVINLSPSHLIAPEISDLVIEREKKKIYWRNYYKNKEI